MEILIPILSIILCVIPTAILQCPQKVSEAGLAADCRYKDLSKVPQNLSLKIVEFDLSQNSIVKLTDLGRYMDIKILNMSHNLLSFIKPEVFDRLLKLEVLDLTLNELRFDHDTISPRFFMHTQKLSKLLLAGQFVRSKSLDTIVDVVVQLENLTYLSLSPFTELPTKLASLPRLRTLNFQWGDIDILSKRTLEQFSDSSIEELSFHQCGIRTIENGSFDNFINLRLLNVACNYDLDASNVFSALSTSTNFSLDSLILDGITKETGATWEMGKADIHRCQKVWSKIKRFSMRGITVSDIYTNVSRCMANVNILAWGYAKIRDSIAKSEIAYLRNWKVLNMTNLVVADLQYINHAAMYAGRHLLYCVHKDGLNPPENKDYFINITSSLKKAGQRREIKEPEGQLPLSSAFMNKIPSTECVHVPTFTGGIKYLDISHFSEFSMHEFPCLIFSTNTIEVLNMSYWNNGNEASDTVLKTLHGPILGLNTLHTLDMSFSGVQTISASFFTHMPSLRKLYLRGNKIHPSGLNAFPRLELELLNLNNNFLSDIEETTFSKLKSLQALHVQQNDISKLGFLNENLISLVYIDLSHNKITSLTKEDTSRLDRLHELSGGLTLVIDQNPFVCGCYYMHFLNWFKTTKVKIQNVENITCIYDGDSVAMIELDENVLDKICSNMYLVISLSIGLPLVISIIVIISYKKRWSLRWNYHVFKRYLRHLSGHLPYPVNVNDGLFHAFVIFPIENDVIRDWVFRVLRPKVESDWLLKLHLFGRDDSPGAFIMDNVVDGIKVSRKAIWLVTPEFIEDNICVHAAHFALCHQKVDSNLIIIFDHNRISNDRIPRNMTNILNPKMKIRRIKYTEHEDGNRLFWDKLQWFLLEEDGFNEDMDEQTRTLI